MDGQPVSLAEVYIKICPMLLVQNVVFADGQHTSGGQLLTVYHVEAVLGVSKFTCGF